MEASETRPALSRLTGLALWGLALLITLSSAVYQRLTGPTHPMRGEVALEAYTIGYRLLRSWGDQEGAPVRLRIPEAISPERLTGTLYWKRHKMDDPWHPIPMWISVRPGEGAHIEARIPPQPPAGKVDYRIRLALAGESPGAEGTPVAESVIPAAGSVTLRYRGYVPGGWLIPHVLLMFAAILFSNRAAMESLRPQGRTRTLAVSTLLLLIGGGLVLGPIVQYYAFGAFWTGWPLGTDLTDNKTAVAVLAWGWAVWASRGGRRARGPVLIAALITLAVYLIPHSLLGSELDYTTLPPAS